MEHRPVISRKDHRHILYIQYHFVEPYSQQIICPTSCGHQIQVKTNEKIFRLICPSCEARLTIPKHKADWKLTLGQETLIKTAFPQEIYLTMWELKGNVGGGRSNTYQPDPAPTVALFSANHIPTTSTHLAVPQPLVHMASSLPAPIPASGPSLSRLPSALTICLPPKPSTHTVVQSKSIPSINNHADINPVTPLSTPFEVSTDPQKWQSVHGVGKGKTKQQKKN